MKKCNHATENLLPYRVMFDPGREMRYCPKCDVRKIYRETRTETWKLHYTLSGKPYADVVTFGTFPKKYTRERPE